jgi:phage N-6-adenine-methyltransferase
VLENGVVVSSGGALAGSTELVRYEAARTALAEAHSVDEVKDISDKAEAMRLYALQAHDEQLLVMATDIRLRAKRRLGELLEGAPKNVGGRPKNLSMPDDGFLPPPTLSELGITRDESSQCQKLARMPEGEFETKVHNAIANISPFQAARFANVSNAATRGNVARDGEIESDRWHTPAAIIELARTVMGKIDLDPASNADAQEIVKAAKYYTRDNDGLTQQWAGRVWLNPPWSYPLVEQFIQKLVEEFETRRIREAVVLVNNATDTEWFQTLAKVAIVMFARKRISCWRPGDDEASSPRQGQALFYIGDNAARFRQLFSEIAYGVLS